MQEVIEQVLRYLRGIWRYRWYIHLIAWPICIGGWIFVSTLPDQYESSARVYVDTKSALRPLLRGLAVQSDLKSEIDIMTRTLLSRPNLEQVVRMTDMDLTVESDAEFDEIVERLKNTIEFKGGRDNLFNISYTDSNPKLTKNVVQALLTIFVESSLGGSRKDSSSAQRFLEQQLKEYEQRLYDAEERVKEFKRKNLEMMPERGQDYFSRLKSAKGELKIAKSQLAEVVNRRNELRRQIEGEEPTFGLVPSASAFSGGVSHPLDGRIADLEKRMDELLLKYTARHPDVVSVKDTIDRLKERRENEIVEAKKDIPDLGEKTLDKNPVYQQLKISLGQAEAEAAALETRVGLLQKTVRELEQAVDTIPKVEAEFQRLNRDYSINKKNYEALLSRRESANLAQQADQSADDVKFKIIEPPRVPAEPAGPNRLLFEFIVLLGGLGAGLAFAFFLSQIKPTFYTQRELSDDIGLPVYGSVAIVRTPREIKIRLLEVAGFIATACVLMLLFAGFVYLQLQGVDIGGKLAALFGGGQ